MSILIIGCKSSQRFPVEDFNQDSQPAVLEYYSPWVDYQSSYSRFFDLIHTKLDIEFNWEKRQVYGEATLYLSPYFYSQQYLYLDAREFDIHEVQLLGEDSVILNYENDMTGLMIDLNGLYTRNDTITLNIKYTANPYRNSGFEDRGLYFVNHDRANPGKPQQIWTQGETENNSRWFPTIESPGERCTQEIYLTVADEFKTLSNGLLVSSIVNGDGTRTDYWRMDKPHAPYLFMVAVGDFTLVRDQAQGVPLGYWVEPDYAEDAHAIFGNTGEMISFFSGRFDFPFPWQKYDQVIVRDFITGAMENTTASVFMEDLLVHKEYFADNNWDDIISHELTHQWFGNLVTCESWANVALNEAFATYGEYLWIEYKYGPDEAGFHAFTGLQDYLEEASYEQKNLVRFYFDDRESLFDNHTYAKGARILHMLRLYVGDDAFFASLSHYLRSNQFRSVEIHDLRKSFEQVTGEDLNWFFTQWFLNPGHPELKINHYHENDTLYIMVKQDQDLSRFPLYYLPVHLDLAFGDSVLRYPMEIMHEEHLFKLPLTTRADAIVVDGDCMLVGTKDHAKSGREWINQVKYMDSFRARHEGLTKILSMDTISASQVEAIGLGLDDESPRIQEMVLSYIPDKESEKLDVLKKKVIGLLKSSSSKVRGAAIIAGERMGLLSVDEWISFLEDSSYYVKGVVLDHLLRDNSDLSRKYYDSYKEDDNINIILPVGGYINSYIKTGEMEWYLKKMLTSKSPDQFFILHLLNQYLINAPILEKKMAINLLFDIATQNADFMMRLTAYQGLLIVSEIEGVEAKLSIIKSVEPDPELLEIYGQY